jgi:hypothetical protein
MSMLDPVPSPNSVRLLRLGVLMWPVATEALSMRAFVVLLCLALAACSTQLESTNIRPYVPPSPPTLAAAREGIKKAAMEEKLTGFIEMSDPRQSDHGPGRFVLCLRGAESEGSPRRTYAVFFENEDYKGVRMSVMIDDCEKQDYRPLP